MTKTQAHIVELIAQLPLAERRELFEHVQETGLLDESFYSRMTPEQRAQLDDGIAQADRGESSMATRLSTGSPRASISSDRRA